MKQTTLSREVSLTGISLHEGHDVTLTLRPAPAGAGYTVIRADKASARIAVHPRNIVEKQRRTLLFENGVEAHTVEHVLAALYGMGVDNAELVLTAPEPPAGDGSALVFCDMIKRAGITQLAADRTEFTPTAPVDVKDGNAGARIGPGKGGLEVEYTLDYGVPFMPRTTVRFTVTPETFEREIGPARTFCLEQEALMLKAAGFGKGANTQNTLVVGPKGPMENTLRYPDEYARHKLLDVIGDLAVTNLRLNAMVAAERSGHSQNQKLAKAVRAQYEAAR